MISILAGGRQPRGRESIRKDRSERKKAERRIQPARGRLLWTARVGARCRTLRDSSGFNFRLSWGVEPAGLASGRDAKLAVAVRLEMHKALRLGRRPPTGELCLEPTETDAPQAHRSPECSAGVEAPGDLMDAVRGLPRVTRHRKKVQEVRHLDWVTAVGERDDPGGSTAHARVAESI